MEIYEEYFAHSLSRNAWLKMVDEAQIMRDFRTQLFTRMVPNLKEIGLLTDRMRPKYEKLGILKYEHGLKETFPGFEAARQAVNDAVKKYNELRIHDSCNRLTPVAAHEQKGVLKKYWKPKVYAKKEVSVAAP